MNSHDPENMAVAEGFEPSHTNQISINLYNINYILYILNYIIL